MFKHLMMIVLAGMLAMGLVGNLPSATHAQSDEALARIDQAMAHLGDFLGGRTITRAIYNWRWTEQVWDNEAMDCPIPDTEYPNKLTRGYQIDIVVDDVTYDYRVKSDGSILILCIGGQPDPSSQGVSGVIPAINTEVVTLQPGTDWSWFYHQQNELLYLINTSGVQVILPRPKLPNEIVSSDPNKVGVAISRDGNYMVVKAPLNNGRNGLGIYSFQSGNFVQTHQAEANEEIYFGYVGSNSALMFNRANTEVAVAFAVINLNDPSANTASTWRIIRFNLQNGEALGQLTSTDAIATSNIVLETPGTYFPYITYYDEANGATIHFQLIFAFAGGASRYPAYAWSPSANQLVASPYFTSTLAINTVNDAMIFPKRDPNQAALDPNGPFESFNVIIGGSPAGFSPGETVLYTNTSQYIFATQWAAGDQLVLFMTGDQNGTSVWHALNKSTNQQVDFPTTIQQLNGTANGFWSLDQSGTLNYYSVANIISGTPVAQNLQGVKMIWTVPADSSFAPTQLVTFSAGGAVSGTVHCTGAPPSIVAVNTRARVTVSADGETPLPLRLRTAPAGEFIESIPEGTQFSVIGGPQCAEQYTWWQIRLADGSTGWAAEGSASDYFMEPIN